ncbi:MAG: Lrp/AsnC ligand binding domain-containing protein [Lysobacterales bacterium]
MNKVKDRVLDRIDLKILRHLQGNARMTNVELARSVNLSPTPCLERVRRLEADGYILDYITLLNPHKLGAGVISFIQVQLDRTNPDVFDRFKEEVALCPEVMECFMVAGGFDYLLKVRTRNMLKYRDFLGDTLARMSDIKQTHTYVVMEEVKATHKIAV